MKKVIIMRGLPGSGKSTKAARIQEHYVSLGFSAAIVSTDNYFVRPDGKYCFDKTLLGDAHEWNFREFKKKLAEETNVIIFDNTNVRRADYRNYIIAAKEVGYHVYQCGADTTWESLPRVCAARTIHAVPLATIERMYQAYEPDVFLACYGKES